MEKKNLVFVYGTLRKHQSNAHLLKDAILITVQCWTNGEIYDSPYGYPFMKQSKKGTVYGELYQVNEEQLKVLDDLEDYSLDEDNLYDRVVQTVYTDTGSFQALVYVLPENKQIEELTYMTSGNWSVYRLLKDNDTFLYFAYGSCMDRERFKKAGVNELFQNVKGRGVLEGYQLRFTIHAHDGGRADIVEEGGTVEGIVYEVTKECLEYLYEREGVEVGWYRPAVVDVDINGTSTKNVLTFVVVEKEAETAPPTHYFHEILRGGNGVLSHAYLEKLKKHVEEKFH
ncbi:gamma-glutamylcyclotransferase [Bacillus sp. V3B]|uniref:gamma-glutamylcyclotransferase n=1 Tax=Bacillus sp. V3B TaxID=2804915 RepID=UPI002109F935|nr:gamma-glutamylcyclotransferase family protein [Bacillus sp. V3B]MCQ6275507.1 gamma-glutamylcyclotransferase [Bacillus sp. V3B]